jgi:aerobic-type carbon monoxide dehydrogenase small subunit (CoxS/CutS family)
MARITELDVNGTRHRIDADADRSLLSVLREDLDLTGAKYACGEGQCGACVVLLDGRRTPACITRVGGVGGREITTLEGIEEDGRLHALQQAFLDEGAMQCGYCTPGMILSAAALLRETPDPDDAEISRYLEGNICRCGAYRRIIAAVRRAAEMLNGERGEIP